MNISELLLEESAEKNDNSKTAFSCKWQFWCLSRERTEKDKKWKERLKKIGVEFDTLDSFWTLLKSIQTLIPMNDADEYDFMLFRQDVPPLWEHAKNVKGGRWVLNNVNHGATTTTTSLTTSPKEQKPLPQSSPIHHRSLMWLYWENCCLLLVKDKFDADLRPLLNGVWLNLRLKYNKVSLWTSDFDESHLNEQHRIVRQMRGLLKLNFTVVVFEPHEASIQAQKEAAVAAKTPNQSKNTKNKTNLEKKKRNF